MDVAEPEFKHQDEARVDRHQFEDDYGEDFGDEGQEIDQNYGISEDITANPTGLAQDEEFESALTEVERYKEVLEKNRELERTIIFQKAKIEAIQTELDGAISVLNEKDIELQQVSKKDKSSEGQTTKFNKKISKLEEELKKANEQNKKQEKRIKSLESYLQQAEAKINRIERDTKKASQDVGVKDVRLNRVLEELEKQKLTLKETKEAEEHKNKEIREELDRVNDENKKLDRQRSELLQVFKKQNKLIDILKKQKMHIEAAKMLSFTEDEFTKLLDV
ncbi:unnamed protein product [Moneuplotes crassus]|uniref:Uncharacterized protein n=1 Tax=Euplotes crassus TaxID=5936 RepID=A0AAD2CWG8_EUPCR|nr:unnamed protein product [Moneuplotes crassus]